MTDGIDWAVENAEDFMEKLMNELSGKFTLFVRFMT